MAYSDSYFTARESWRDWRIEAQTLLNLARVTPSARVLEIGCGGGGLLRQAHARGAVTFGVDTLENALQLARTRADVGTPRLVRIGEDGALPFRTGAFDALLGQHVVEHVPDVDVALREWRRVLKPGGRIALATPNARYPDPAHFADPDHTRVFAPAELRAALMRAGFAVEMCITIFPFLTGARALCAFGVRAYRAFQHMPYFATRGRTLIISAQVQNVES